MVFAMQSLKTAKPVVFGFSGDPVEGKLVQSWPRPGGNFTGMSYLALELVGKRIELLKEWLPQTRRVAILARPQHPGEHLERKASEAVVGKLGIELSYFPYYSQPSVPARNLGELETAFRAIVQDGCDALVIFPDSVMYEVSGRIAQFALDAKLPSVSGWSTFARKGCLMTYGPNVRDLYRSLARYVDRILRGTAPPSCRSRFQPNSISLLISTRRRRLGSPFRVSCLPLRTRRSSKRRNVCCWRLRQHRAKFAFRCNPEDICSHSGLLSLTQPGPTGMSALAPLLADKRTSIPPHLTASVYFPFTPRA